MNKNSITQDDVASVISHAQYHRFKNTTVTICCITLKNGHSSVGQSACVDPENFDEQMGMELAYNDARSKIFGLEGYLLSEALYQESRQANGCSTDVKRAFIELSEKGRKMEWPESTEEAEQDELKCCGKDCGQCTMDDEFPEINIDVHPVTEVTMSCEERDLVKKILDRGEDCVLHLDSGAYQVIGVTAFGALVEPYEG